MEELKKDIESGLFFALNGVLEKWEMCPWESLKRPWIFCSKHGTNPESILSKNNKTLLLPEGSYVLDLFFLNLTAEAPFVQLSYNYTPNFVIKFDRIHFQSQISFPLFSLHIISSVP